MITLRHIVNKQFILTVSAMGNHAGILAVAIGIFCKALELHNWSSFSSIVESVGLGRRIFDNIKKSHILHSFGTYSHHRNIVITTFFKASSYIVANTYRFF